MAGFADVSRGGELKINYDAQAAECLKIAQNTSNPEQRALLLSMAQSWRSLAQSAHKVASLESEAKQGEADQEAPEGT